LRHPGKAGSGGSGAFVAEQAIFLLEGAPMTPLRTVPDPSLSRGTVWH
jgi:hypothetical protein